ncbi:MAG: MerR family transcriptional regulator [Acidobacteria bacterium]|nr:MerR family transcriptional regulator [Acidobacteriota bacterium]
MELLTTNDAAKILGKAGTTVLYYERTGKLRAERTKSGLRLFNRSEVEALAKTLRTKANG